MSDVKPLKPVKRGRKSKKPSISTQRKAVGAVIASRKTEAMMSVKRSLVLSALSDGATIKGCCEMAGISRSTYFEWAKDDDWSAKLDSATQEGIEVLEEEMVRRATDRKRPSDLLLIFALKSKKRSVYGDRQVQEVIEHKAPGADFDEKFAAFTEQVKAAYAVKISIEAQQAQNGMIASERGDPAKARDITPMPERQSKVIFYSEPEPEPPKPEAHDMRFARGKEC